ncbi:hypothetical protein [Salinimicrobium sediminilitoris]|uniref:hypothetical protein n=1 Tax=Salinimicrobium sediminilitoris TaxID=2876715 RepID=UPI001E55F592|nr:hypothetical protein [Salinimicrobium sediminilitoris]MCC8358375.1 hypothetical protein [Salinimicrobium sediminilitoris]
MDVKKGSVTKRKTDMTPQELEELWEIEWEKTRDFRLEYEEAIEKETPLPTTYIMYVEEICDIKYVSFYKEWVNNVNRLNNFKERLFTKIANEMQFYLSKREKLKFIGERTTQLRQNFQKNNLNHLFTFSNFEDQMINTDFVDYAYENYENVVHEKFVRWIEEIKPQRRDAQHAITKCKEIWNNDFFKDFGKVLEILSEIKMLQLIYTKMEGHKELVDLKFSPYPMVFSDGYGHKLFNFLLSFEPKRKKSTAFISKYFYLFQKEGLIEEKALWADFFRFLEEEHTIIIKRIDERAQPEEHEFHYFKKIKINFEDKYTSIN